MSFIRRAAAFAIALLMLSPADALRAQAGVPPIDQSITYILPQWGGFYGATDQTVAAEVAKLRTRIGEGRRVRVGFTVYASIYMSPVDPTDAAAVRAALAPTLAQMDTVLTRARQHGIPLCISFVTALRSRTDEAQAADQAADRRTMQWHSDNSLAPGWATLSRYARVQQARQEAFLRELGRQIAVRMAADPETFVAASGDGEVELSYDRSVQFGNAPTEAASLVADYSPFAVAEFRDWLRGAGMYAAGQPFAGEAYVNAARYAGDATPADLNADFGKTIATTWKLKHFDWSLSDATSPDPKAIPSSTYSQAGWLALAIANASGFDAPRVRQPADRWWQVWDLFRQTMVGRYNRQFAKWITTSPDAATGATVPASRWFSDQIPADYLFGFTPANPDFRLATSASPWWTADTSPYGSLGITSFNQRNTDNGFLARTLAGVAPQIAQRGVRWGIFEWTPSVPVSPDVEDYRREMALVEQYRPSLLVPWYWQHPDYPPILGTGFEVALKELVQRLNRPALTLSPASIEIGAVAGAAAQTPPQTVRVSGFAGETPVWAITAVSPMFTAQRRPDGRSFSVALAGTNVAAGTYTGAVTVTPTTAGYGPVTLTVTARITSNGASTPPFGVMETPLNNATGVVGSIPVTGWALDDVGVASVKLWRDPVAGEAPGALVFVGDAVLVEGARLDLVGAYPTLPNNTIGGWGYLLLTNMLPTQGNGTFRLHAIATDREGKQTLLGSRTITCSNSTSTAPFGAIDTPAQGQTVSGSIVRNFGWVLVPGTARADVPGGGTVVVVIDGAVVGVPGQWTSRSDISTVFPTGFSSLASTLAVHTFDSTTLSNGVHTIAWGVTANNGQGAGIGSRYFTVSNGAAGSVLGSVRLQAERDPGSVRLQPEHDSSVRLQADRDPDSVRLQADQAPLDRRSITGRRGFNLEIPYRAYRAGTDGRITVQSEEIDRIELRLSEDGVHKYSGYLRAGAELGPLPIGSQLDASTGVFTWQPGVGFVGPYDFVFVDCEGRPAGPVRCHRQEIRIVFNPKASGRVGPQVIIDIPTRQQDVGQPFVIAGWAVDLDQDFGSGIDAVHVWAYPLTGGDPVFLGAAHYGGARPDVAAIYGDRFKSSGYGLMVQGLEPGNYDLAVFSWSTALGRFAPAKVVRVTVR